MKHFKNWASIAQIQDSELQIRLALAEMGSREASELILAHPEHFSETEDKGPFSLKLMLRIYEEKCKTSAEFFPQDKLLVSAGVVGKGGMFEVPIITFAYTKESATACCAVGGLPENVTEDIGFGKAIGYKNWKFVVVIENNHCDRYIDCVPAEFVVNDL